MEFDILQAISTVGFPIAAACALFWLLMKMVPVMNELSNNTKDMKESLDAMKNTLELFNQNFVEIFRRLSALEADSKADSGKHVA